MEYSVQIDNRPYVFASVFERIDAYVGWKIMTRTDYVESREIYIVFNFEEEEILISDKPYGKDISDLDEFLNSFFDNADDEEEECVIEVTTEANKTEENQIKEMEKKEMTENTFAQTLTNEQVKSVATAINAVYIMMGVTNKNATTEEKVTGDTTYTALNLYVDGGCVMTMMGNYEESTEKLFEKVMFGNRISVTNTVEKEYPVHYDALVDFATWCKDQFIENDEDAVKEIREEYGDNTSLMNFMEIPELKRKFKLVICNKKQEMRKLQEVDMSAAVLIPMDEDYDPEHYIDPCYNSDAFIDEDGDDECKYERNDWEMTDYEMSYTTEMYDVTLEEVLDNFDGDEIFNFDDYKDELD